MTTLAINASHSGFLNNGNGMGYVAGYNAASPEVYNDDYVWMGQIYHAPPAEDYHVYRAGMSFPLSTVPSGVVITGATISLYGVSDHSDTNFDITMVSGADLADVLVAADFVEIISRTTALATVINSSAMVLNDWNVFTLNTVGVDAIRNALSAGDIRFAIRSSREISATTPKVNGAQNEEWVAFDGTYVGGNFPILTLTYVAAESIGAIKIIQTEFHYIDAYGV